MKKKNIKNKIKINPVVLITFPIIIFLIIMVILFFSNMTKQDNKVYVATVNSEGVLPEDYEKSLDHLMKFYTWSKQNIQNTDAIKKDVLERLIEQKIMYEFAVKNNIKMDEKELLERYQSARGKKTEEQYLKLINDMYGMSKKDFLQNLSDEILKEKIQSFVKKPFLIWLQEMKKKTNITRYQ